MTPAESSSQLQKLLRLRSQPVAVAFVAERPEGVDRLDRAAPSGCSFWKLAGDGAAFYTEPSDHYGCPIGCHTHGLPLPPEQAAELGEMLKMMVGLKYLSEPEIADIPTLAGGFRYAVYAPLAQTPVPPDVVMLRGTARQMMVAGEAARAAGIEGVEPVRERPTCAVIPQVMASGRGQASFACIGNRVYTGLGDEEIYFAVPGGKLDVFVEALVAVAAANDTLEAFHRSRLPQA